MWSSGKKLTGQSIGEILRINHLPLTYHFDVRFGLIVSGVRNYLFVWLVPSTIAGSAVILEFLVGLDVVC